MRDSDGVPLFLIADDSPEKVLMLRHFLKQSKWIGDIVVAETTEEAVALIDVHPEITAAFVDYYIPLTNGPSIIRYLKEKIPAAHIALVSSADSEKNAARAREAGAEAVICTSHQSDEVERNIIELLRAWIPRDV